MSTTNDFRSTITEAYSFDGPAVPLGGAMLDGQPLTDCLVRVPLRTLNRHGLIAGATGTGKTKTLQLLSESLSAQGVPVLLMDIKGDLSGLAQPSEGHPKIDERHAQIGLPFEPSGFPIELLTISKDNGVRLRATVSEFGPVLLSKILGLNDTQSGIVSLIFKYCDDHNLLLLDLKDFRKVLQYVNQEGKDEIQQEYGLISSASVGAISRKLIELEQQGADLFFGERSFDPEDLLRTDDQGRAYLSILRLTDIQDRPKLFSTFMLCLLAEVYATFPEAGDADKPKLVIFIDEAHLLFDEASDALLNQVESIIKLIRSKGVGIFFCTQLPSDIPDAVLSQLGLKVQHALRAFTAKDRKNIKLTAENFPLTDYYDTAETLTQLGIGEALVTVLDEKGRPTPLVRTLLCAPRSRMDVLTEAEIKQLMQQSELAKTYNEEIDRESAYEVLTAKLLAAEQTDPPSAPAMERKVRQRRQEEPGFFTELSKNTMVRQIGRTVMRELTRSLLGVLGVKRRRR